MKPVTSPDNYSTVKLPSIKHAAIENVDEDNKSDEDYVYGEGTDTNIRQSTL